MMTSPFRSLTRQIVESYAEEEMAESVYEVVELIGTSARLSFDLNQPIGRPADVRYRPSVREPQELMAHSFAS